MIETDRRDHAQQRVHDVGRIEPPAQARFDHRDIDLGLGEVEEHQRDGEFKERQRQIRAFDRYRAGA